MREIRIEVPEIELRRLDTTISDVSPDRLPRTVATLPSGTVEGTVDRQLRTHRRCAGCARAGAHVEVKSFTGGEKVLLGDIATRSATVLIADATRGLAAGSHRHTARCPARADRRYASRLPRSCRPISTKSRPQLPPGIEIATYEVAADALSARIWLLVKNGLGGLLVVVAILFVFLNARIAFWVAAGIPVAMLATIGFMYVSGQTINMISLFSLIMMLGSHCRRCDCCRRAHGDPAGDGRRSAILPRRTACSMMLVPVIWLRCRPHWLPSPRS
jgi:multidrug efflux pump subunit AcrB